MGWLSTITDIAQRTVPEPNEVREWREKCAAIDLEEKRALKSEEEYRQSCSTLTVFWLQNVVGCILEAPVRTTYHGACAFTWCLTSPCASLVSPTALPVRCTEFHCNTFLQYRWLWCEVLARNVIDPRSVQLYKEDHRLNRPPRPVGVREDRTADGKAGCCEAGCCTDCCLDITGRVEPWLREGTPFWEE